jgi:hypothetical protein
MKVNATIEYRIPESIFELLCRWGRNADGMPQLYYKSCAAGFQDYHSQGFREESRRVDMGLYDRLCHRIDTCLNDFEKEMLRLKFRQRWPIKRTARHFNLTELEYLERFRKMSKRLVGLIDNRELDNIDVLSMRRKSEETA